MTSKKKNNKAPQGKVVRRPFWLLYLGLVMRVLHQIGAAVYLTSYLVPEIARTPEIYLYLAVISGFVLLFTETARHREMYRELSGIVTFIKLLLLGAAFHIILPPTETVIFAFVIASLGAHAPKNIRHRLLF